MRGAAAVFAAGLAVGVPCLVSVVAGIVGWVAPIQLYMTLGGTAFGAGLILAAALDLYLYRRQRLVDIRLDEARAWDSELKSQERAATIEQAVARASTPDPADDDEWYTRTLRPLFTNGHRAGGFSHGLLGRTMAEDDWSNLCAFYASADGRRVLRLEAGNVGYVLNTPTWTHAAVMREITNHTLPHPEGLAPDVDTLTDDAARRAARRGETVGVGGSA